LSSLFFLKLQVALYGFFLKNASVNCGVTKMYRAERSTARRMN